METLDRTQRISAGYVDHRRHLAFKKKQVPKVAEETNGKHRKKNWRCLMMMMMMMMMMMLLLLLLLMMMRRNDGNPRVVSLRKSDAFWIILWTTQVSE